MHNLVITFRCLLRIIFRGPEMIQTPGGRWLVKFQWRDMKRVTFPTTDPTQPAARSVVPGYAGDGCYIKLEDK